MDRKTILGKINKNEISIEEGINLLAQMNSIPKTYSQNDIAIIGVSGRFPEAKDIDEFWDNIKNAKDCVKEVSEQRWDVRKYYSSDNMQPDKTYCVKGGTIVDYDVFDAAFFKLSPIEAELMDPQQRIFLEESWKAVEDSGYTPEQLSAKKCGVFVGATSGDYNKRANENGISSDALLLTGNQTSMISARIAYYMDLTGPNLTIDTACSSSLVAIHLACQSIRTGEADIAIAGGVSVLTTPDLYIMASKGEMLSPDGKCKPFDANADGFVPSEGAGVLVLKNANSAVEDNDNIYGVIVGDGINYDGKTNGITAPSASSQANLERDVYNKFNINPESISYIEAHGTGTKIGDPIEIAGLSKAFNEFTSKKGFCGIGSVKSNVGHALAASGVISVIKVLLCMKNRLLVKTINVNDINDEINMDNSPFYLVNKNTDWNVKSGIRRAAINSFGLSGTNCHIVIEENRNEDLDADDDDKTYLFMYSAKTEQNLIEYMNDFKLFIESTNINLGNISYTLAMGREKYEVRTYITAATKKELINKLKKKDYIIHNTSKEYPEYEKSEVGHNDVGEWLKLIGERFIRNKQIDVSSIFDNRCYRRVSIPKYHFSKEKFWINNVYDVSKGENNNINMKKIREKEYCIKFSGDELYIKDHIIDEKYILPGAAQLSIAYSACIESVGWEKIKFSQVQWIAPINVENDQVIFVTLKECNVETIEYTITNEMNKVFSKGLIQKLDNNILEETINILPFILDKNCINKENIYDNFCQLGIKYGESFQVLENIYFSEDYCISKIRMDNKEINNTPILKPALIDGIFQTVMGFKFSAQERDSEQYLPYKMGEFILNQDTADNEYYILARNLQLFDNNLLQFDISVYSITGKLVGMVSDYQVKSIGNIEMQDTNSVCYLKENWVKKEAREIISNNEDIAIVFSSDDCVLNKLSDSMDDNSIYVTYGENYKKISESRYIINKYSYNDYFNVLEDIGKIQKIIVLDEGESSRNYEETYKNIIFPLHFLTRAIMSLKYKVSLIYFAAIKTQETKPFYEALGGYLKTVNLEDPDCRFRIVYLDSVNVQMSLIKKEINSDVNDIEVKYNGDKRYVKEIKEIEEIDKSDSNEKTIKYKGTYLITGGGGIGITLAKYLYDQYNASVIICGRTDFNHPSKKQVKKLINSRDNIEYFQTDMSDLVQVKILIQKIKHKYNKLDGIFHTAGLLRDAFVRYKTVEDMELVIAPKIKGLFYLYEATKDIDLDFLVSFSSLGAVTGNLGQCDYCYANSFMDSFCMLQNSNVNRCKYISINWPLWADGGMKVDNNTKRQLRDKFGMIPLENQNGFIALESILKYGIQKVIVIEGDRNQICSKIKKYSILQDSYEILEEECSISDDILLEKIKTVLKEVIGNILKLEPNRILDDVSFDNYGIDSVMVVSINNALEKEFGLISKTLLFEYRNIQSLAEYFTYNKRELVVRLLGIPKSSEVNKKTDIRKDNAVICNTDDDEIVIVGMAGQFPLAHDYEEYWQNLVKGRDCITTPPEERKKYLNRSGEEKGVNLNRWGGFIDDIDKFDASFFNISPKEIEMTDPQERLFLEIAWKTFTDAGYSRKTLEQANIGVYVGAMYGHYELFGVEETIKGNKIALNSSFSSIANRVSYFFNLNGPSIALDTMCSSGLTALHLACQSIRSGDCEAAIVGATNLSLHENKYLLLSQGNFLSKDGKCKSFGKGGNGYVPGEGVGALLIKSKTKAIEDHDYIYAKVLSSSINHGGKTNGYTVPNPVAQGALISETLRKAKVPAESISYVEAHGTGTALGDPIEISGLVRGFKYNVTEICPIGSVKSNIGHLEAASGIAALIKVVLMLKNKKLVPSIHSETLNENLNLSETPFYIQHKYEDWIPTYKLTEGRKTYYPRRAGISSFGAGGSNSHVIIEEYSEQPEVDIKFDSEHEFAFVFSAENKEYLYKYLNKTLIWINKQLKDTYNEETIVLGNLKELISKKLSVDISEISESDSFDELNISKFETQDLCKDILCESESSFDINSIPNIRQRSLKEISLLLAENSLNLDSKKQSLCARMSYTLQVGREVMNSRLIIIAPTLNTLKEKIELFINQGGENDSVYFQESRMQLDKNDKGINYNVISLRELALLWVNGSYVNWQKYWGNAVPNRIPVPIQELNRKRYWFDGFNRGENEKKREVVKKALTNIEAGELKGKMELQMEEACEKINSTVTYEIIEDNIAVIKMQNLNSGNTFTDEMIEGIMAAFNMVAKTVKVIIITGDKNIFCMGGTKEQLLDISNGKRAFSDAPFLFEGLQRCEIPVIAAMQGHASGGGMLFGLYADITIMAREAVYCAPFLKYGFTPGMGATYIIPKRMGDILGKEMLFSSKSYRGEELEAKGASLIFAEQNSVLDEAIKIARSISDKPREVLSLLKRNLNAEGLKIIEKAISLEEEMHIKTFRNPEVRKKIGYYYGSTKMNKNQEEKTNADQSEIESILDALQNRSITAEQASQLMSIK